MDKINCEGVVADETDGSVAEITTEGEVNADEIFARDVAKRSKSKFIFFSIAWVLSTAFVQDAQIYQTVRQILGSGLFQDQNKRTNLQFLSELELATSPKHVVQASTFWEKARAWSSQYRY